MKYKKNFRGTNFTDEEKTFIVDYDRWYFNHKHQKNREDLSFKKLNKILLQTSDVVKISVIKKYGKIESSLVKKILKSIDWNKQSSRTKLYLLKVMHETRLSGFGFTNKDVIEIMFGNIANMREVMKFFGFEFQVEILLLYSYKDCTQQEEKIIVKDIMEDPRTTSKTLFEFGYYRLAGVKYYDESQNPACGETTRFLKENNYSKNKFIKLIQKINGVIQDDHHYTIKERFEKEFQVAYLQRRDKRTQWEFIAHPGRI